MDKPVPVDPDGAVAQHTTRNVCSLSVTNAQRERVVKEHMRLVESLASAYARRYGCDREDLVQEGLIGLIRAMETFDPKRGASFKTHAYAQIRGAIWGFVRKQRRHMFSMDTVVIETQSGTRMHARYMMVRLDETVFESSETRLDNTAGSAPSPEDVVARNEQVELAIEAIRVAAALIGDDRVDEVAKNLSGPGHARAHVAKKLGVSRQLVDRHERELVSVSKKFV